MLGTFSDHYNPSVVDSSTLVLAGAFLVAAVLYASVGHAGASGYLAAMAFVGMPTPMMRPTALVLNLLVASIATLRFGRAGLFSWGLFWPFALGSVPLAFLGGAISLPGHWYRTLVGLVLWAAAVRLWLDLKLQVLSTSPKLTAVLCGAGIGLLAGLTGTGGGIFLSPLLLFMGWAETRETGGVSPSSWSTPWPGWPGIREASVTCRSNYPCGRARQSRAGSWAPSWAAVESALRCFAGSWASCCWWPGRS